MKNNKGMTVAIIYGIVLVLFNVVFWCIPFPKNATSIILYAFSLVSIIGGCGITMYAFSKGTELRSKVYGFPVFRMGYIYMIVQLLFSVAVCVVNVFIAVPAWIAVVVSVLILGLSAIGVIATDATRDIITEQEKKWAAQTAKNAEFRLNIDSIAERCPEGELKKKLSSLAEEFRFSDPISSDALTEIEKKLGEEVAALKALVTANPEEAIKKADEVHYLLADRNRLCKASKKQ